MDEGGLSRAMRDGEWWLLIETTRTRAGCLSCRVIGVGTAAAGAGACLPIPSLLLNGVPFETQISPLPQAFWVKVRANESCEITPTLASADRAATPN